MSDFRIIAEERIRQAMRDGKFDNLPGKGKPLLLDDNPYIDPSWRMAFHLLKTAGLTLPWIALRQDIEQELQQARQHLLRARTWCVQQGESEGFDVWQRAKAVFRERIEEINRRILAYNLQIPSDAFHRRMVDASVDICRLEMDMPYQDNRTKADR